VSEGFAKTSAGSPNAAFKLVFDDELKAKSALDAAGTAYTTNEAFLLSLANQPGVLGNLAKQLGDSRINITSFYVTMQGKQVLGVDNVEAAKSIVS